MALGPEPRSRPAAPSAYWVWWGPVFGLSQHLELALPFQVRATQSVTELESFEADLRYRLFPRGTSGPSSRWCAWPGTRPSARRVPRGWT